MPKRAIPAALALATLVEAAPCAAASPPDRGLGLLAAVGGEMRTPLVSGDHVYVPTGRTLTTWNYADRAAPRLTSSISVPVPGVITGLARPDADGIHELDVADPALPRLVRHTGLVGQSVLRLRAVPDGRLFAFTQQAGVHILGPDRLGRPCGPVIGQQVNGHAAKRARSKTITRMD